MKKHIPIIILFLLFCIEVSSQTLIPFSGSNSVACGTNTTLCTHAGCGATYSNNANGYTVLNAIAPATITISGSYSTEANYDYIRIYAGVGTGGTLLATYHGSGTINYTGTAGQTLTVSFTSDGSVTSTGLNASVTYGGSCGCINTSLYPTAFAVPTNNTPYTITTCQYQSEYNQMTGVTAGQTFQSTASIAGTYITVRSGTYNGAVVAAGSTPLSWTAPSANTYFIHYNTNSSCGVASVCMTSTITCTSCIYTIPLSGNNSYTLCSGTLYEHAGTGIYANNANGYTVLYPSIAGNVIRISGTSAGEACCDYVRVYNGVGLGGTLLGQYNMGTAIPTLTSTDATGALTVQFVSDVSVTGAGPVINISCVCPTPTAGSITPSSATICQGSSVNLNSSVNASSGGPGTLFIEWYRFNPNTGSWEYLGQNNSQTLTGNTPSGTGTWTYLRRVWSSCYTNCSPGCIDATTTVTVNATSTLGTVSNAGPINFCDASGNFGTAVTVSGQTGTIWWDWGSNNGVWNNDWVAGSSSGVCCFPKKTSNSDANADRIRYRVTNGVCPTVTSGTILIVNRYNEAPTSLASSSTTYCSNAAPANITLTATFPTNINKNGTVAFYSGSCGGTLLGSVTAGDNTTTAALTIAAPATTTTYFVRYEPGTGTGCSNTACVQTTVTVNPAPSNDACANAINIGTSLPYTSAVINNSCATDDFTTSSCDGPYKNVWWTVTGICGTMTAITCTGGTNFDNEIAVFTGSCGSFTEVTCNDDNGAGCTSNYAGVSWTASASTIYYISVGSYFSGGTTGNLQLNVTASPFTSSVAPTAITGTTTICNGSSTMLTVSGGSAGTGATAQWFTGSCGGTSAGTGNSITVSPTTTTTYYVRYAGTCNTTTCASVTVTVDQFTTANAGPDQTICSTFGNSATLAANTPATGVGTWSVISGSGTFTSGVNSPNGTVTGLSIGNNTFRWTLANGLCADSQDDVVITREDFTASNAGPDQTVCATSATLAANTPVSGVGTWSVISGSGTFSNVNSPTSSVSGLSIGVNTFRWNLSNGSCTDSPDDVIITRDEFTTANAGPDQTICSTFGNSATLAANTPATGVGTWSVISGSGTFTSGVNSPNGTVTGLSIGNNTFRWTLANGLCADSQDDVVITREDFTASNAGPDQTVCATSATLAANTPVSGVGTWSVISGSGTFSNVNSPTSNVSGLSIGVNTFRWNLSNGSCTDSPDDVIITRDEFTTANAGPDQTICSTFGNSATLAANTPATGVGTWSVISGSGTFTSGVNSPNGTVTGLSIGNNTFRWTLANGLCADSQDDVVITREDFTASNAGPDQTVCATSATLAANTPATGTGTWTVLSGTGTFANANSPTSTVSGLSLGANTFRWTLPNGVCTDSPDDVIITRNDPSVAPTGATGTTTICNGGSTTLTLTGGSLGTGATWQWYSGSCGGTPVGSGTSITVAPSATTAYFVRAEGTCNTTTCASVTVTVAQLPTTANAGPDQNVCATSVTLAANTPSIGTGAWSIISGAGGSVTTPTSPTSTFTGVAGTTYTLRWTISNAPCTDSTDDVVITLTANPTVANAGPDQNVCATSATLAANTPSIGTGAWSIISGAGGTVTTPTSPTSTFTGVAGTSYTLRWTISNAPCAASTDDVVITIDTQSVAPTGATGTTTICDGGSTTLTVAGGSLGTGAVVEWFTGSCGGTSAGTGNSITVSPTTTTTYYVRYNGTCNTTTCATVTVTVNTLSVAASSVSGASTICNGGSAALTLSGGSLGTGATWQWYSGSCGGTPVGTGTSITVTPSATTTYFVRAEGTCNTTTCPSGATVTVVSSPTITSQPNSPAAICAGATSSNITVVATGGTPSLTYQWEYDNGGTWVAVSNGTPTGASYSGGTSPSMAVTLANASNPSSSHQYRCVIAAAGSGCASVTSDVVTVTVYALPQITSSTSSLCEGATRTLQSDIAVVTWTASGCPTCITGSNIFTAPDPGGASANYTITASNNGCYGPASSYVQTVYDAVNADAGTNQTQCNNGTFTLAGNTPPAYPGIVAGWTLISGTATITTPSSPTSTVTGVPEGSSATLQWTIFNGSCTSSSTVILANNRAATVNAGTPQTICAGGTVTLAGSIGGSATTSTWSAPSGTFSNVNSLTSTYTPSITSGTVTLTLTTDDPDGAGPCGAAIATVIITVNERPSVTTSVVSVGCFGGSNGSATANVIGGTPAYTYSWNTSPTQSTQTATNLLPGTYTVTVTDQNGCSSTAAAVVSEPSMPLNATSTFVNETCNQLNNGSIDVSVSGGTSPYTYIWSNGANTQDLNPVAAGTYVVTITDNNGCVTVLSQTITQPSLLAATITPTNETCNELNNGTATVNVTGGSVPIGYLWSTTATTVSISSLSAGSYSVTVTDNNGCTTSATTLITQPDVLTINAPIVTNESCSAANNGSIAASVNGGTTAYTYTWSSGGGNVPTISDLDAGTYSLTVTDINSCATTVLGIVVGSSPTPSITVANSTSICAGGVANLVASVTNPDAMTCGIQWQSSPDGSSWSNISGATGITYTSSALSTTTYYRAIYDCSTPCDATSNTAVITVNAVPSISVSGGTSVCVGGDATLTATPAGGANGCSIQWESSPNGTTWTPIPGANATTYTTPVLSVTTYYHATYTCGGDGCGTATSASATVTVTLLPIITIHDN